MTKDDYTKILSNTQYAKILLFIQYINSKGVKYKAEKFPAYSEKLFGEKIKQGNNYGTVVNKLTEYGLLDLISKKPNIYEINYLGVTNFMFKNMQDNIKCNNDVLKEIKEATKEGYITFLGNEIKEFFSILINYYTNDKVLTIIELNPNTDFNNLTIETLIFCFAQHLKTLKNPNKDLYPNIELVSSLFLLQNDLINAYEWISTSAYSNRINYLRTNKEGERNKKGNFI